MLIIPGKKLTPGKDSYTKLLLHMNGADNGTVFTDECDKTVTRYGNTCTKTGIKKFGTASGYFDGNGDYLTLADSDDWNFGSGVFTVDCWIKASSLPATNTAMTLLGTGSYYTTPYGGWFIGLRNISDVYYLMVILFNSGGVVAKAVHSAFSSTPNGTFTHCAVIRNGNNLYAAIDGALGTPVDITGVSIVDNNNVLLIGHAGYAHYVDYSGYIDELRISKGIARWTSNFIPPVAPYY